MVNFTMDTPATERSEHSHETLLEVLERTSDFIAAMWFEFPTISRPACEEIFDCINAAIAKAKGE